MQPSVEGLVVTTFSVLMADENGAILTDENGDRLLYAYGFGEEPPVEPPVEPEEGWVLVPLPEGGAAWINVARPGDGWAVAPPEEGGPLWARLEKPGDGWTEVHRFGEELGTSWAIVPFPEGSLIWTNVAKPGDGWAVASSPAGGSTWINVVKPGDGWALIPPPADWGALPPGPVDPEGGVLDGGVLMVMGHTLLVSAHPLVLGRN